MPAGTFSETGQKECGNERADPWDRRYEPDFPANFDAEQCRNLCGQIENHTVDAHLDEEIDCDEMHDPHIREDGAECGWPRRDPRFVLFLNGDGQRGLFVRG